MLRAIILLILFILALALPGWELSYTSPAAAAVVEARDDRLAAAAGQFEAADYSPTAGFAHSAHRAARSSGGGHLMISWDSDDDDDDRDYASSRCDLEARRGRVRFCYEDDGYEQVYIRGSFTAWEDVPLHLDVIDDVWYLKRKLPPGRHRYQFVVEEDDEVWTAIDPDNPLAERSDRHGWVSVLNLKGERRERFSRRYRTRPARRELEREYGDDFGGISYQRVDGWFLYYQPDYFARRDFEPSVMARLGYGFKSKEWSLKASVVQPLLPGSGLMAKLSGYATTDYTDQTSIGDFENTLATVFFREDFRDYYRREGVALSLVFAESNWLRLEAGARSDDYFSLENATDWSLEKGEYIPNPAIDEGSLRSLFGRVTVGRELNQLDIAYEISDDILASDHDFAQVTAQYRARLHLGPRQHFDFRLKGGTNLRGSLPVQKRYVMGGLGTVRGYGYQSLLIPDPAIVRTAEDLPPFGGQRMALFNAEYSFSIDSDIDMILFYDAGMAWEDKDAGMALDQWRSSAGFGFRFEDEGLRVDFIQPLDEEERDFLVQLRLERMF